jgi:hypothetical protein
MFRYNLRTLLIVLALAQVSIAFGLSRLARVVLAERERASKMQCNNTLRLAVPIHAGRPTTGSTY